MFVQIAPASAGVSLLASHAEPNLLEVFQVKNPHALTEANPSRPQVVTESAEPIVKAEPAVAAPLVSDLERQDNSFGVWLIGLGSAILIAFGLIRRFSGR